MPPTERPLEGATIHHVALSVGDLDTMSSFYAALGFDEVSRVDFAPASIRLMTIANQAGARLELTANDESEPAEETDPTSASRRRGPFHFALAVSDLADVARSAVEAGARIVIEPTMNARGDAEFAYIKDPEGNLIELIGLPPVNRQNIENGASPSSGAGEGSSELV